MKNVYKLIITDRKSGEKSQFVGTLEDLCLLARTDKSRLLNVIRGYEWANDGMHFHNFEITKLNETRVL